MTMSVDTQAGDVMNGSTGRTLREGTSNLEVQQRNQLDRNRKGALKEVAGQTRLAEATISSIWKQQEQFGDLKMTKLQEAVSESAMPQLLRFGVQNFLFDGYASVPVIYPDLVRVVASGGAEELYAPLYGAELPAQLAAGQEYGDSRLLGLDVHVPNQKYGRLLSIERELIEDDRTGQIVTRAGQMGERMRYVEEKTVIAAIKAGGTQGYNTTIGNTPASPGLLSGPGLIAADQAMQEITDPLGNLMLVMPDTLLVSPSDKFNAAMLLNSALQPSVPGASGQTANTATSGLTGWTMTVNPLQGLYNLKVSRFLNTSNGLDGTHGSWFLLEAKKSIVFQDRTALQVMQEAVNSGGSFDRDVFRYRVDRRFASAVIESRYLYAGN
jgi:phage major head subunit gpT-like protein